MILKEISDLNVFASKAEPLIGVFGSAKWLSQYGSTLKCVGIYKDELQLIGGFFYLKTKKYGFTFIKLPPYTPHCGFFYVAEGKNNSSINNFSKEIMNEVCNFFKNQNAALTILAFPFNVIDFQAFIWNKFKVTPNYTYRINLLNTEETIRLNFDSKNRTAINKAIKEGVSIHGNEVGNDHMLLFFSEILKLNGANYYKNVLAKILNEFSDDTNSFCFNANLNGKNVGMVFCIFDKTTCYYLLGGTIKNSGVQGVNNLLVQHCIFKAKELGCNIFDFEGSMIKGVEKFFRGFGPQLIPYFTVNKAILPLEMLLKFKKREIF